MDEYINPDILEILLSDMYQVPHVLNGYLTSLLRYITETHNGGASYYKMDRIFKHGSLQALEPEYLKPIYTKLYTPDNAWKNAITEALKNNPDTFRYHGINMEIVKYSHIDFNLLEYNNNLYNKLYIQTNSFDPVELGKRVILIPGEVPNNFDDLIKAYEPCTKEFRLITNHVKREMYKPFLQIEDTQTLNDLIERRYWGFGTVEEIKREIAQYRDNLEKDYIAAFPGELDIDESELTIAKLETYREKYEACINVTQTNTRLYTRARYILNMFIDINESVIKYVVNTKNSGFNDNLLNAYEYLGLTARHILTHFHRCYLDYDNFPTFSNLYLFGSIENRPFPESIIYTNIQKLCFCQGCKPFLYSAQLYEGNNGQIYILVDLKVNSSDFLKYVVSKKCHYRLFLSDMPYHYRRLEALFSWRQFLETGLHKQFKFNMEYVHRNYGSFYHNWFSSNYVTQRCVLNAERIFQTVVDGD